MIAKNVLCAYSYGDRCPAGNIGRAFATIWVLIGLVVVSLMTGALTTALTSITEASGVQLYGSKVKTSGRITRFRWCFITVNSHYSTTERWI